MVFTKIKLLNSSNDKIMVVSYEGIIENPFEHIRNTEYANDYKVIGFDVIDLGITTLNERPRVTIGEGNCIRDCGELLNVKKELVHLQKNITETFNHMLFDAMAIHTKRLVEMAEDLDDMANELINSGKNK
jgi:hypothetical protein